MFTLKNTNHTFKGAITFCPYSKKVSVVDTKTLKVYSTEEVEVVI